MMISSEMSGEDLSEMREQQHRWSRIELSRGGKLHVNKVDY